MKKVFKAFHYLSFMQYPFMAIALFFCYRPIFTGFDAFSKELNLVIKFLTREKKPLPGSFTSFL